MNKAKQKTERVMNAISFQEPDRVPMGEFFWGGFIDRWRREKNLTPETNIYEYYDLDLIIINPNMDPHIKRPEILQKTDEFIIFKTGFEYTVRKKFADPMPEFIDFSVKSPEEIEEFEFDDPHDSRRYYDLREDSQSIADGFQYGIPSFVDTMSKLKDNFCIFGSVCESYEALWRIVGYENALLWIVSEPERIRKFSERITDYMIEIGKEQIRIADLKGLMIAGDVAYRNGMLFSPKQWKELFFPCLKRMCEEFHKLGVKLIYHGCGNAEVIFDELIEAGIDAYNPLEARAGLDVVKLKEKYGKRLAFNGNISVEVLEKGDKQKIKQEVLRKLSAGRGGGYIAQSDHSITADISAEAYDYFVSLVKEYGKYPLAI